MSSRARLLAAAGCAAIVTSCASPRFGASSDFVRQWKTLRVGMSASEVHQRVLRRPFASYEPTDSTEHIEYWLFAPTEFRQVPPSEAYVVWYTTDWKIKQLAPAYQSHVYDQ